MSLYNDFTVGILAEDRIGELHRQADRTRLFHSIAAAPARRPRRLAGIGWLAHRPARSRTA